MILLNSVSLHSFDKQSFRQVFVEVMKYFKNSFEINLPLFVSIDIKMKFEGVENFEQNSVRLGLFSNFSIFQEHFCNGRKMFSVVHKLSLEDNCFSLSGAKKNKSDCTKLPICFYCQ